MIEDSDLTITEITPIAGEPDRYQVPASDPAAPPYVVDMNYNGKPGCSCRSFEVRGTPCRHIRNVQAWLNRCYKDESNPFSHCNCPACFLDRNQ